MRLRRIKFINVKLIKKINYNFKIKLLPTTFLKHTIKKGLDSKRAITIIFE